MIEIDGSFGEGGGQILRTALALSVVYRQPLTLHHIRAKRKNPGLGHQHLMAVNALAKISGARVDGNVIGSQKVTFSPGEISSGDYRFQIGTAGSTTLLLQALLLPLCLSEMSFRLILEGGTHVLWSPPYHYFSDVLFPTLHRMGVSLTGRIDQWGWYPKGGGLIQVEVQPGSSLKPISCLERGRLKKIYGLSAASHLPKHVTERQREEALRRIEKELRLEAEITLLPDVPSKGAGSFLFLVAETEKAVAGFSSLGRRGKRAEEVARETVSSLKDYLDKEACLDPHLADQLIPFMALAKGSSSFTTTRLTEHLLTNVWVVRHFTDVQISVTGEKGEEGKVECFNE
ncbi:MAG: RNA 3'-terminal phosphate cyclase [Thermodesulfobacteriota bacterium]